MRPSFALVSFLVLAPPAFADCAGAFAAGGSAQLVTRRDQRALEALLGVQVDEVVCGRMKPARRFGFAPKRGFFVLTADEVVFVGDRKTLQVLFRAKIAEIVLLGWSVYQTPWGPAGTVDSPVGFTVATDAATAQFELPCDHATRRALNELERRALGNPGLRVFRPPGAPTSPCG